MRVPGCGDARWQGTEPRAGWFGAQASLAARLALVFDGGAALTKRGGWFFASPGSAHTRTHQEREMERKSERESKRKRLSEGGAGRGMGR